MTTRTRLKREKGEVRRVVSLPILPLFPESIAAENFSFLDLYTATLDLMSEGKGEGVSRHDLPHAGGVPQSDHQAFVDRMASRRC